MGVLPWVSESPGPGTVGGVRPVSDTVRDAETESETHV